MGFDFLWGWYNISGCVLGAFGYLWLFACRCCVDGFGGCYADFLVWGGFAWGIELRGGWYGGCGLGCFLGWLVGVVLLICLVF